MVTTKATTGNIRIDFDDDDDDDGVDYGTKNDDSD